jgi:hypothetical protein
MKQVFCFSAMFLVLSSLYAQTPLTEKPNDLSIQKNNLFKVKEYKGPMITRTYGLDIGGMKLLFENNKGKVYESPIDKMHVLVPTFESTMPVARSYSQSNMPVLKILPEGLNLPKDQNGRKLYLVPPQNK